MSWFGALLSVGGLRVSSVESIEDITVPYGTTFGGIGLPVTVDVTLSDSSVLELNVFWQLGSYDGLVLDTYSLVGILDLQPGITNPGNIQATVDVIVEQAIVESVEEQTSLEVAYGTAFGSLSLPSQVDVLLNSGRVETVDVTWAQGDYLPTEDFTQDNIYTLIGTLENLPSGFNNSLSLHASIIVTVLAYDDSSEANSKALYQAIGSASETTVSWPVHAINDIGILVIEQTTDDTAPTESNFPGWTQVPGSPVSQPTGSTRTRLCVFVRRATSTSMPSVTLPTPTDHIYGVILTVRGVFKVGTGIDVIGTSIKAASTSLSIAAINVNQNGNDIIYLSARGSGVATARYSAQANASLTGLGERFDAGTITGGGGGLGIWSGNLALSGSSGTLTATIASSTAEAYMALSFKGVNNFSAPTTQDSSLVFLGDRALSWTKGSGAKTLILYNLSGTVTSNPVNGVVYDVGDEIGTGNFVMFNGNGTLARHSDAFPDSTTIAFRAYSYNTSGSGPLYNTNTATNNPITPTTADPDGRILYHDSIVKSTRVLPSFSSSESFGLTHFETATEIYLYWAADGQGGTNDYKRDRTFLSIFDKTSLLDISDPANWIVYDDNADDQPDAVLVSDGTGQIHMGHVEDMGGGNYRGYYSASLALVGTSSIGYATSTDLKNWTKIGNVVSNADGDILPKIYKDGATWHMLTNQQSGGTEERTYKLAHWTSSDGLAWTKIDSDILIGTGITGIATPSDIWKDGSRYYFYLVSKKTGPWIGNPGGLPLSPSFGSQLLLVSTSNFSQGSIIIEKIVFDLTDQHAAYALNSQQKDIVYDGRTFTPINAYKWQVQTTLGTQVESDINVRLMVDGDGALLHGTQVGLQCWPDYIHRFFFPVNLNEVDPIEIITQTAGTIVGAPATTFLQALDPDDDSSVTFSTSGMMPDPQNFCFQLLIYYLESDNQEICNIPGCFSISVDYTAGSKLKIKIYGSGGVLYKEYQTTSGFNNSFTDTGNMKKIGFLWNNGVLKVTVDYDTDVPVTILHDDSFTDMATPSSPLEFGNTLNAVGPAWVYSGAYATEETIINDDLVR